jgi:lysozyme
MATLKLNSKGEAVKMLQQNLLTLGYAISVDGVFGKGTETVVKQFQMDHNLSPDGVVGTNTFSVIDELINKTPIYGIDISHHNGAINFNLINKNIIKFAYCKASQGKSFKDEMLLPYMNELQRLGIYRGAYHFMTFKGVSAEEQVSNFLNCGLDFTKKGMLPPVLDVEWQQSEELNLYIQKNKTACIKKVKDWLIAVENATGKKPIIYTANSFWRDFLSSPTTFGDYPLWLAAYKPMPGTIPAGWNAYTFWQFTESGSVDGLPGHFDKNVYNGTLNQLKKLANG